MTENESPDRGLEQPGTNNPEPEKQSRANMTLGQRLVPVVVVVVCLLAMVYFVIPLMKERNRREELGKVYRHNLSLAQTAFDKESITCGKPFIHETVEEGGEKIMRIECREDGKHYELRGPVSESGFTVAETSPVAE